MTLPSLRRSRPAFIFYMNLCLRVTVSIGVAARVDGDTVERLMTKADNALYQAKRDGCNRAVLG